MGPYLAILGFTGRIFEARKANPELLRYLRAFRGF